MSKLKFAFSISLLFCTVLGFAKTSLAATYYVANAGSDSNVGTDQNHPWQTIAKINASSFSPGDSILFNRGDTWKEELDVPSSGNANSPIIFGAYSNGENPIITGTPSTVAAIRNTRSYCTFENLTINNPHSEGIFLKGPVSHISIQNIIITGGGSGSVITASGIDVSAYAAGNQSDNITINNVTVTNFPLNGIWINGWNDANRTTSVSITNSTVSGNGGGVYFHDVTGGSVTNTIMNNNTLTYGSGEGEGMAFESVSNVTISGCTMANNRLSGAAVWARYSPDYGVTNGCRITKSSIHNNGEKGIYIFEVPSVTNFIVDNNILYNNAQDGISYGSTGDGNKIYNNTFYGDGLSELRLNSGVGLTLQNNILYSTNPSASYYAIKDTGGSAAIAHDHNLYYKTSGSAVLYDTVQYPVSSISTFEAAGIGADPLFTSASDFHLRSSSPAINAGTDVGLTTDFASNSIVGAPDIGAYEYQGTAVSAPSSDTTSPAAPTGLSVQ